MITRDRIYIAGIILAGMCFLYIQLSAGSTPERELLLVTAKMWLHGKRLYDDLFTVQMPLIFYMYALSVVAATHIGGVSDAQIHVFIGVASIALCSFTGVRILEKHNAFAQNKNKRIQFIFLVFFVFLCCINPAYFFDREHIFLVFTFPYVLRWMPSVAKERKGRGIAFLIGVMAAVGFCIKPHCFVLFACVQVLYFVREKSLAILLSTENVLIYLLGGIYLFSIYVLDPTYFHIVLPMALATYSAASGQWGWLLNLTAAIVIFAVSFADFRLRYTSPYRDDIKYLIGICLALVVYALSNNGWGYTYVPLDSMILITTGFAGWEFSYLKQEYASRGLPHRQFQFGMRACVLNLAANAGCIVIIFMASLSPGCGDYYFLECNATGRQYLKDLDGNGKNATGFGTISMDFALWARLASKTGVDWQTRFNHLWMLPRFFASDAAFKIKNQWILDYVGNAYAQDLNSHRPQVVFVDDTDHFYSVTKRVNLIAYLSQTPAFAQAWRHYRYYHSINDCTYLSSHSAPRPAPVTTNLAESLSRHCGHDVYQRIP